MHQSGAELVTGVCLGCVKWEERGKEEKFAITWSLPRGVAVGTGRASSLNHTDRCYGSWLLWPVEIPKQGQPAAEILWEQRDKKLIERLRKNLILLRASTLC